MALYKSKQVYKTINGEKKRVTERVKVTAKEARAYIMKVNGWTGREYEKKYDILRNKVRAFEAYERKHGGTSSKMSVQELLYKQAKAKTAYGDEYKPSLQLQRIEKFVSISSGQKGIKALETGRRYQEARAKVYTETTQEAFKAFIEANPTAREINERITDPVQKERALKDLAEKVKAKINNQGATTDEGATFSGSQSFGSSEDVDDFDINEYL